MLCYLNYLFLSLALYDIFIDFVGEKGLCLIGVVIGKGFLKIFYWFLQVCIHDWRYLDLCGQLIVGILQPFADMEIFNV